MKIFKLLVLTGILCVFHQSTFAAFSEDVLPPEPFPVPEPQPEPGETVDFSARLAISPWRNSEKTKINVRSRMLFVSLILEEELKLSQFSEFNFTVEDTLSGEAKPVRVLRLDVNRDGIRDLVFLVKTGSLFEGLPDEPTELTLRLDLLFENQPFEFHVEAETFIPKQRRWFTRHRRR